MKILNFSTICLAVALTLGLFVAWSVATPAKMTDSEAKLYNGGIGDGCPCSDVMHPNPKCRSRDDFTCTIYTQRCEGPGDKKCIEPGGAGSQPCYSSISRCYNDVIQDCE